MNRRTALLLALALASAPAARAEFDKFEFKKPFGEKSSTPAASTGKKAKAAPKGGAFKGKLGFSFRLPGAGKKALKAVSELDDEGEAVYVLPPGVDASRAKAAEAADYAKLGLIKVEAVKIATLEPDEQKKPLEAVLAHLKEGFDLAGEPAKVAALPEELGASLEGRRIDVGGKAPRVHVLLRGSRLIFSLQAGRWDKRLETVVSTLEEGDAP